MRQLRRSKSNILLVGNWRSDTGYAWKMIERFWIAIAQAFHDKHTFLCFPEVTTVNPEIAAAGIVVEEFDFNFRRPTALAGFCRARDIGLIYLTDRPYSSSLYPLLRASGVHKIVIHDHTPGQRTIPSLFRRIAKTANGRVFGADEYIACSEQVLERLAKVGCIPPERCHLALNGIDLSRFPHPLPTIREELSISRNTVLAVSSSRVHPYKRIGDIVDAAALLTDLDLHFIHIGDGPDFDALQSRIRKLGLDSRFTLLGQRNDVPKILAGCDMAIHASSGEGLSLSILEFMASRLAVIVTDEPSVSQIIEPDVSGLKYRHGNVEALAAGIRILANDPQTRVRLGQGARTQVENRYRIEHTASSVVDVLKRAYRPRRLND